MRRATGAVCLVLALFCTAAGCGPDGELVEVAVQWDAPSPEDVEYYEVRVSGGETRKIAADPRVTAPQMTVRVPPSRIFRFEVRSCRRRACSPWTSQELMASSGNSPSPPGKSPLE